MTIKTQPKIQKRTLATIIDYGLYFAFFLWAVTTFGEPNEEGSYSLNGLKGIWVEIVWVIYFPVIESITGQTLGKRILGLRVVTKSGNPISFGQAVKRRICDFLDFGPFGLVAYLTIKNTPDHQRLGDLWAKTIVIGGDDFACTNCRELATLTADEILKREFVCPTCKITVKI
jgi:uncharacterized RDD family membrane protein YckC